ncbi:MAG TPA: transglycosylase SLT domain-containing protein [Vicinamibacteria bacterium]
MGAPLALLLLLVEPSVPASSWRMAAEPRDAAEAAVREAVTSPDPIGALSGVAQKFAGTPTAGLARLGAGLRLLDAGRPQDALTQLTNADVEKMLLRDQALLASSRALEALKRFGDAARAALAAADDPGGEVACEALPEAARLFARAGDKEQSLAALERAFKTCPALAPETLLTLGNERLARGDRAGAAAAFEAIERGYPLEPEAQSARARLIALGDVLPPRSADERARMLLERGGKLLDAGRTTEALAVLRTVPLGSLSADDADLARVRLARALLARGSRSEGRALLLKVEAGSPHAAEAAFRLAGDSARRTGTAEAYIPVTDRFPGTPWGEDALLALANHFQKDALDDSAAPWWRRLLAEYPDGRYAERAAWRAGWGDFHAGRFQAAADTFETTARRRPPGSATAGLLYWSGRARLAQGDGERARALFVETIQRYKNAYHGVRAQDALARLGGSVPPAVAPDGIPPQLTLPEPRGSRARLLLLIDRLDEAADALRLLPEVPRVTAALAWVEWRRGRFRPGIVAMKRAYPDWISEAGDRLPREVWQVLYPIRYEPELVAAAREDGLDPALVAALILQESSFDADALSRVGARGLMQVMPTTGRRIARAKGVRYKRAALNDPMTSLDFGTHYLRQMSERFSGAAEQVLAAYNAGPHRVDAWTAMRGEQSPEEFIETIPFSETRSYVMIVLANREQYRRLYGLARSAPAPAVEAARP